MSAAQGPVPGSHEGVRRFGVVAAGRLSRLHHPDRGCGGQIDDERLVDGRTILAQAG